MRHDFENAKLIWGLWNTGSIILSQRLIDYGNIERILVPEPKATDPALTIPAELSGQQTKQQEVDEITRFVDTTAKAKKKAEVRMLSRPLTYAFTIFDEAPIGKKPCSRKAWILVQVHEPDVGTAIRKKYVVENKGRDKERFEAFIRLYERLWNEARKAKS